MPRFLCTVVIPTRELYSGVVTHVEVPGMVGNFGVLAGHEKLVAMNRPGVVTVTPEDSSEGKRRFAIYSGLTQMDNDHLIVMGRMGCEVDKIDVEEVRRKAENMRATIAELEQQPDDEIAVSKLEVQRERLAWYETQISIATS